MERMPERRRSVLEFLEQYIGANSFPPSVRDIGRAVGISSTSVVDFHLRALENDGYIRRARDISRGIEILAGPKNPTAEAVQVVGTIAAGLPIEAVPDDTELIPIPPGLLGSVDPQELFALHVKGDSMVDELIGDGDVVLVRRQDSARDGDIVVALLTDTPTGLWGATLKRFYREGDTVRLQPANPTMSPIYVEADKLQVQGKVVALIRRF